jgi:hypothetical protein
MVAGQQLQPTVAPAVWEIYALLPAMIILMVLFMAFRLAGKVTEPEFIREVRPVAEDVALARAGGR